MKIISKLKNKLINSLYFSPSLRMRIEGLKVSKNDYNTIFHSYETIVKAFKKEVVPIKINFPNERVEILDDLIKNESEAGDWLGNVIVINGKYFRGINKSAVEKFINIYETGIYNALIKEGYLIPFEISKFYSKKYPIILGLSQISPKKCIEWNLVENKKALLFCSKMQYLCKDNGFALTDNHIYNIVYSDERPIYIDHGSLDYINKENNDYSLIITLVYRIIFSSFSNSFFYNRINSPKLNEWAKNKNELNTFEYVSARNAFLKFHKKHSSKCVYRAAKNILIKQIVNPWDVEILFKIS